MDDGWLKQPHLASDSPGVSLIGPWGWVRLHTCCTLSNQCAKVKPGVPEHTPSLHFHTRTTILQVNIKSMRFGTEPHTHLDYRVVLLTGLGWYYKAFPCQVILSLSLFAGVIRSNCIPCESHFNWSQGLGINSVSRTTTIGSEHIFFYTDVQSMRNINPPLYIFTNRKWLYMWNGWDYALLVVLVSKEQRLC